ncbi:MAG: hypothetical protein AB1401_03550 [Thermodesulfobacteriota bacterium]
MESKIVIYIITTIVALSGWITLLYNWFTSTPKIKGKILNIMTGEWHTPQFRTPKTSLFVYLYLTNKRKNPVHILDYELEFDISNGYEKALRVYGTQNIDQPSFHSDIQEITIPDFKNKVIYSKNNPIEYGIPLHGFALFATDKPHSDLINKIKKLKITCTDAFGVNHIIKAKPKNFTNLYLLQDIAGINIKQKTTS